MFNLYYSNYSTVSIMSIGALIDCTFSALFFLSAHCYDKNRRP